MASSGKKGKKNKGTVISLQSFLSNGSDTPIGTTQVSKKVRNYDGDDSDDGGTTLPLVFQLPTAPRANRIFEDDSIPHKPPFLAYITNLPFDINEDDIYDFFGSTPIISLRLPREDGENGRVRGFGYVEFDSRDDLINVLSLPDPSIKGRRIRIDLSNENEQQSSRQRSNRRGYDGFGNSGENRDSTNWRRDNYSQDTNSSDRGYTRDRKIENVQDNATSGSWRTGSRNNDCSTGCENYIGDRYREGSMRSKHFDSERLKKITSDEHAQERPKLNLKPRTLPLPEIHQNSENEIRRSEEFDGGDSKVLSQETTGSQNPRKVFGAAKPVDTAARELEIEARLAQARRDEKLKQEQDEKLKKNDVDLKLAEVQLEKPDKENANAAISWRCRDVHTKPTKDDARKYAPDFNAQTRKNNDDKRKDNVDFNREDKHHDKNERFSEKVNLGRDLTPKDDGKIKRDIKQDHSIQKPKQHHPDFVLQTCNKYSGLDDEASD